MANPITGVDHGIIFVRDLEDAAARYRRLGFSLTPRYAHPNIGTANYNMMFGTDYLELLAPVEPNERNAARFAVLERSGEGLKDISLAAPSADAAAASFGAAGLEPLPAIDIGRPVTRGDGTHQAKFRILYLPVDRLLPGLNIHVCQHRTPELVWLPEHQRHANGALGMKALVVAAVEPASFAATYAALFGVAPRADGEGGVVVPAGRMELRFVPPPRLASLFPGVRFAPKPPFVAALEIQVADAGQAKSCVAKGGAPYIVAPDGAVEIAPDQAGGVLLRLSEG